MSSLKGHTLQTYTHKIRPGNKCTCYIQWTFTNCKSLIYCCFYGKDASLPFIIYFYLHYHIMHCRTGKSDKNSRYLNYIEKYVYVF